LTSTLSIGTRPSRLPNRWIAKFDRIIIAQFHVHLGLALFPTKQSGKAHKHGAEGFHDQFGYTRSTPSLSAQRHDRIDLRGAARG
jgi:hypothetical protein